MAQLQCYNTIKNRTRTQSTTAVEASTSDLMFTLPRKCRQSQNKQQLYDIEIIEEEGSKVKIHYIGYDSRFDEWKPKEEVVLKKPQDLVRDFDPLTELACQIKRRLVPSRHDDPDVRIQTPATEEAFKILSSKAVKKDRHFTIKKYKDLDDILGPRWHIRVVNRNGDFSYVILETIRFRLVQPRNLLEYEPVFNEGSVTFEPQYVEQCLSIVFTFVRGDGNKSKLLELI